VRNTSAGLIEAGQLVRTQVPYPANVRFEMKNLKADTIYRIELRAHNVIGFSAPAEILLRTAKGQFFILNYFPPPIQKKKNISFLSHHFLFFIKL
jgi:hypothetical protein